MDIPVSSISVTLKQINPDDLDGRGLIAMEACFRGFTEPLAEDSDYISRGEELFENRFGTLGVPQVHDLSPARRFAGDNSLGRGRYFSVCHDEAGDDGGTLARELLAYHNPLKSGLVTIIDSTVPGHRRHVPVGLRESGGMVRHQFVTA